jgi:acyl carrier protein
MNGVFWHDQYLTRPLAACENVLSLRCLAYIRAEWDRDLMVVKPSEASGVKAAAHSDDLLMSATERAVAEVFAAVLNVQWVSLEDDIFALGGDSFEAVRVALELERRFQIEFSVELIESAGKVRDIAAWISARSPSHLAGD